ncbi:MAG: glycosyltransferase family 2 protein [Halobacteriota archaeon]
MPLVSTFMKSYNHERYIAEAIESVLRQDFEDLELIIVDDASTDASRQIIERYAEQDPRIRLIFHERNLGISKVVNDGIDVARGKFIAQIDSDDVWVRDKLRKQLAVLENNENLIVWSEGELIDENGRPLGKSFSEMCSRFPKKKSGDIFQELLAGPYIFGTSLLYKRQNVGDLRYDERLLYLNDYKFELELARDYQFHYIAEPLAKYRIHGKNALVGSDPHAEERRRRGYIEEISVRQEALRRYNHEVPNVVMAKIYASDGLCYGRVGKNKQALNSLLRSIRSNPYSWLNLVYSAIILALGTRILLGSRISEEKK